MYASEAGSFTVLLNTHETFAPRPGIGSTSRRDGWGLSGLKGPGRRLLDDPGRRGGGWTRWAAGRWEEQADSLALAPGDWLPVLGWGPYHG